MTDDKMLFFEGQPVVGMEGKIPAITLEMTEGYARGTHLKLMVEVRVRNVRYEEDRQRDLTRQHVFALEEIQLVGAYSPDEVDPGVGGSAAAAVEEPDDSDDEDLVLPDEEDDPLPLTGTDAGF